MAATLEREIKLRFDNEERARAAVIAAGAMPLRARRLQDDRLLDTPDNRLQQQRSVLRVRSESGSSLLTFKGPLQPSLMKLREEIETPVADGALLLRILDSLGFQVWFRYQKYREEFRFEGVTVAVDGTPVGTYVEIEGEERGIAAMTKALGRGPSDYLLDSYRSLFVQYCQEHGLTRRHMLFGTD
jgi:predicted adenylyl cyclase CyaB